MEGVPVIRQRSTGGSKQGFQFATTRFLASQLALGLSADQELAFEGAERLTKNRSAGVGFAYGI
jgi:hypothetical protein